MRDIRNHHNVGDIVIKDTTPKDSEYLLPMDGQEFDKTVYALLAELYPSGKLPCLNDNRFLEGAETAGESKGAGLPNITGTVGQTYSGTTINGGWHNYKDCGGGGTGALYLSGSSNGSSCTWSTYGDAGLIAFDASKSNTIYGNATTVQPKSYTVKYYVCYA